MDNEMEKKRSFQNGTPGARRAYIYTSVTEQTNRDGRRWWRAIDG